MIQSNSSIYQNTFSLLQTGLSNKDPKLTQFIKNLLVFTEDLQKERDSLKERVQEMDANIPEIMKCINEMKEEILESKNEMKEEILEFTNKIIILTRENIDLKKKLDTAYNQMEEEEAMQYAYEKQVEEKITDMNKRIAFCQKQIQEDSEKRMTISKIWSWI